MSKLPSFMIIGAMKSATTTLQDQLVQQPGIFMCDPKEPNFFSDDSEYSKSMDWYLNLFESAPVDSLLGEASTHYTKLPTYPETVARIKQHCPNTRFIYVMRHPIDRLVSHYIHEWSMGVYKCGINEAIDIYPELISYSSYAAQLKPYIDSYGKEKLLPVFFDRLIQTPQAELERVCKFIGYKQHPVWHESLKAKNVSNKRIKKFPLYSLLIESSIAKTIRRNLIPKSIRNLVKSKLRMQQRPVISDENIKKLEYIFNKDLVILSTWLGCEINCQNFKEVNLSGHSEWVDNND